MNQTSRLVLDVPRASLTDILDFVGRGSDRNIVIGGGTADVELLIVEDDPFVGCWLQDETVLKCIVKRNVQIRVLGDRTWVEQVKQVKLEGFYDLNTVE